MNSTDPILQDNADALLIDGRPDWEAITFEVHCSRCGYNLRTLTNPRCPECGFEFEWKTVIEAFFRKNFALFEHNWRKEPFRALLRAAFGPIFYRSRFWKRVSLHDHISGGPLAFLILMTPVWFGLAYVATALVMASVTSGVFHFGVLPQTPGYFVPIKSLADVLSIMNSLAWSSAEFPLSAPNDFAAMCFCPLVGILAALALMCSLHETISRFKLRRGHMVRVMAYAAGPAAVLTAIAIQVLSWISLVAYAAGIRADRWDPVWQVTITVVLVGFPLTLQLRSGLRFYLAIPHAMLAAALITVVAILACMLSMLAFFGRL